MVIGWHATIITLLVALAMGGLANWQLRRPAHRRILPIVPWMGVQFLAGVVILLMLAHLGTLATGKPFGRSVSP